MSDIKRNLASIRQIKSILPHSNADALELAIIDGWQVVVKKGEFKADDLCIYFEVDSFLPREERYSFLARNSYRKNDLVGEGYKLRTIKLRGELSQGLALPLYSFNGYDFGKITNDLMPVDVTDILKVQKWEESVPACLAGKIRGNFPSFIPKTDQERVQNLANKIVKYYWDKPFEVTRKMNGSSMTAYLEDDLFGVCSRNLDILEDDKNSFWLAARSQNLETILRAHKQITGHELAIQGELCGPGVQGNYEKIKELTMFMFDVYNITEKRYLTFLERVKMVEDYGITHAEFVALKILGSKALVLSDHFEDTVFTNQILEFVDKVPVINGVIPEGMVFKCFDGTFSFKVISNKYLLNEK